MAESSRLPEIGGPKYHAIGMGFQRHEAPRRSGVLRGTIVTRGISLEEILHRNQALDGAGRAAPPDGPSAVTPPPQRACINCLVLAAHAAMRSISLRRCASRADRTPVLKTFPAIDRAPLCGLERNGRLFPALRADRFCFYALYASRTCLCSLCPIRFAGLAALRLVFKPLVGEKHLLAGREDEFRSTIGALQDLVMVFHTLLRGPGSLGAGIGAARSRRAYKLPTIIAALSRPLARS
jgi:hypothetical protein